VNKHLIHRQHHFVLTPTVWATHFTTATSKSYLQELLGDPNPFAEYLPVSLNPL
jgi:hypothetical protein